MRIPTPLPTILLLAARAALAAPGGDESAVGPLDLRVRAAPGDAVAASVERRAHPSGFGEVLRFTVRNEGREPAAVEAVELAEPAPLAPVLDDLGRARALTLATDPDSRFVGAAVVPFHVRVAGDAGVGLARDDGADVTIAAFLSREEGVATRIALAPNDEGPPLLDLAFELGGRSLAPGERLLLPELLVLRAPSTRLALEAWGLERAAAGKGPPSDAPFAWVGDNDGGLRLALAGALPLDLFQSDGAPSVRLVGERLLELADPDAVARLVTLTAGELDGHQGLALSLEGGGRFGAARDALTLALPPGRSARVACAPLSPSVPRPHWELRVVRPGYAGMPGSVDAVDPASPDAGPLVDGALRLRGLVLAALEGGAPDEMAPLPPVVERRLGAHVAVVAPRELHRPGDGEDGFAERAGNVEWRVGLTREEGSPARVLVSPEAGHHCTPLDPFVADGLPAARGFYVPAAPGAALLFVDVPAGFLDELGERLLDAGERWALFQAVGRARRAVREAARTSGLFARIPLERIGPVDLAPGDPYSRVQYAIQVRPRDATVERRKTPEGRWVSDDVYRTVEPLVFAADFPAAPDDWIVGVVRRAPSRTLEGYEIEIGNRVVHRADGGGDPADEHWIEEWFVVRRSDLSRSQRMMVVLRPRGGVLPVARIGFRLHRPKPGTAVADLGPSFRPFGPIRERRNARGGWLAMGGDVWPLGYGTAPGGGFEARLDGTFVQLLGRAGLDDASPEDARAVVAVVVDGEERLRLELDRERRGPFPVTADVAGAREVRLEVRPPPDSTPDALVDLLDLRFVAE